MRGLEDRLGNHRHVGDIRGRGLMWYPMGGAIDTTVPAYS